MDPVELEKMKLPGDATGLRSKRQRAPRHRPGERFLLGPIPMVWLERAACCPGKALAVGMAIWHLSGLKKGAATLKLSGDVLADSCVSRKAVYQGLRRLEEAGLVKVDRHRGRLPVVTILEVPPPKDDPTLGLT